MALARLPQYRPPGGVWEQLHAQLGETKSERTDLLRAPDTAWDKITDELSYNETEKNRDRLKRAIALMPVYQAPEQLWLGIKNTLDRSAAKVRSLQPATSLYQRVAAVAAVLILFGGAWWMNGKYQDAPRTDSELGITQEIQLDEVEILYSEEAIHAEFGPESITLEAETEPLDPSLDLNPESADAPPPARLPEVWLRSKDSTMQALITEWDELTAAQQHIREAIGDYNDDPRWVNKIAEIERARAQLAKAMLKAQ